MRRRTRIIATTLLVCCFWKPPFEAGGNFGQTGEWTSAQVVQTEKIDAYITQQMQARRIPGLALAVVERGKITVKKAYGIANLETDTPVKTNSIFELASVTKQFTAAAIMLLVEEGKVRLDDPISIHISNTPETWKNITVRRLLTHTAGLILGALATNEPPALMEISTMRTFDFLARAPLRYPTGERAFYSDAGYFLLMHSFLANSMASGGG